MLGHTGCLYCVETVQILATEAEENLVVHSK